MKMILILKCRACNNKLGAPHQGRTNARTKSIEYIFRRTNNKGQNRVPKGILEDEGRHNCT